MRFRAIFLACLALLVATSVAEAVIFPDDSEWVPLTSGGSNYTDPLGDVSPSTTDIVGNSTYSAGYWYYQDRGTVDTSDDEFLFRLRLEDEPNNPQSAWQVLFNTDADTGVDWALMYDASGNPDVVAFRQATVEGPRIQDVRFGTTVWSTTDIAGNTRWINPTPDGSNIGGDNGDVFLDFGMPWSVFSTWTGLTLADYFSLGFSTGASDIINKDGPKSLGLSDPISAAYSDPVSANDPTGGNYDPPPPPDTSALPEPSTITLIMLSLTLLGVAKRRKRHGRKI